MNPPMELLDDLELLEPETSFQFPWSWLFTAALLVGIGWGLHRWWRAHMAEHQLEEEGPRGYEDALTALRRLEPMIETEASLAYAEASTAIIRRYLEARFQLPTQTRTTEEFLPRMLNSAVLRPRHQRALAEYLRQCDLLKYSRAKENRDGLRALHEAAFTFVRETRDAHLAPGREGRP